MKTPKAPKQEPIKMPDPPPQVDQAAKNAEDNDRLRRRRRNASYVFGGRADTGPINSASKSLLGQ